MIFYILTTSNKHLMQTVCHKFLAVNDTQTVRTFKKSMFFPDYAQK